MSDNNHSLIISEFIQALQDEIEALEKAENPYVIITSCQQLARSKNQYWYRFEAKRPLSILKETPCLLQCNDKEYSVCVTASEGRFITLSSYSNLPEFTGSVRLVQGTTALVLRLIQCLNENIDKENLVGARMFPVDGGIYTANKISEFDITSLPTSNTVRQNHAIYSALTNDISYLWGLPGSGKTTVIGQIIYQLYQQNRSVLVSESWLHTESKSNSGWNCSFIPRNGSGYCDFRPRFR